jgi:glycosyltransferase involved in cell wall biosynthesis
MVGGTVQPIPPKKGAAVEWWMLQVSRRLSSWEPHIIAIRGDGQSARERIDGVTIHRIAVGRAYKRLFQKMTPLDPWPYEKRAARIAADLGAALVHVHNAPKVYCALAAALGPDRTVLHLHNDMAVPCPELLRHAFTPSAYLGGVVRGKYPAASVRVLPNGVDAPLFARAAQTTGRDARIPAGRRVLLYAGRMSPEKGPLVVAQAFAELRKRRPDAFLVLAGEFSVGPATSNRVRYGDEIRRIVAGYADDALVLGTVTPERMHEIYAQADLVVVPSQFEEPFGMVALEALAAGRPVLAFRRGGLPEFISDGRNGFLMDGTGDPAKLAARIDSLLGDPASLSRVAAAARESVAEKYDWSVVARDVEAAYAAVLSGDATSGGGEA